MDSQENMKMLESIIAEISNKGHDENLLQQLIKCYLDIYRAKDYKELGDWIDVFQRFPSENVDCEFFGEILKNPGGTSAEDNVLGRNFANNFRTNFVRKVIKENESLKQIYTSLGVLDGNEKEAEFWWYKVLDALIDFDFSDLCQIVPNGKFTNGSLCIYLILEKDLRALLKEKGISEEKYNIDYGTMLGNGLLIVGLADMIINEYKKQSQKGLYIARSSK